MDVAAVTQKILQEENLLMILKSLSRKKAFPMFSLKKMLRCRKHFEIFCASISDSKANKNKKARLILQILAFTILEIDPTK